MRSLPRHNPAATWEGLAKGLLVLGVLWWSWVGYEADVVRVGIVLFALA